MILAVASLALCMPGESIAEEEWFTHLKRADNLTERRDYEAAIREYEVALRYNPTEPLIYEGRALCWQSMGEHSRAVQDASMMLQLNCRHPADAYGLRAWSYAAMREYDKAIADFDQEFQLAPNEFGPHAQCKRGDAYAGKGQYDKAVADYNEALRKKPDYAEAYCNRGMARWHMQDYDEAIKDCTEALRLDQNYVDAYSTRACAWSQKGEYNKAIADFTEAIRLRPKSAETYMNRANVWLQNGDYDNAQADYAQAMRLDPSAGMYTNRSSMWYAMADYESALQDKMEAMRLSHNAPGCLNSLAWLQATCPHGKYRDGSKAVENASKAVELDAENHCYYDTLAAAYAEVGDFDRAQAWQEKAIELAPSEKQKEEYRARLELYKQRQPYRDVPGRR